jgi:hypothetical protein
MNAKQSLTEALSPWPDSARAQNVADRLPGMRRWLAALLLALLSVQLSWAAVAPYCQHEAAQSGHFGHHEHQHHAASVNDAGDVSDSDASTKSAKSAMSVDLDCGQCHGSCVGLTQVASPTLDSIQAALPGAMAAVGVTAGGFERPERPKWSCLA